MKLGKVVGKIWATHKDPQLTGVKLYVLQPLNDDMQAVGTPIIAADAIGSGEGDFVFWVGSREGTFAIPGKKIPSDASIVGIIDSHYVDDREKIKSLLKQWQKKKM